MITDDAIVAELSVQRPLLPSYRVDDGSVVDGVLDIRISGTAGGSARLRLPLPSTGRSQGWLSDDLDTAEHWVTLLLIWIMEEVDTAGLTSSRAREEIDGVSYVILEGYGWRVSDPAEHERLQRAAGPDGWFAEKRRPSLLERLRKRDR